MAGIPTSPLRRGITPFRRSLRVLGTQQSVPFRCLASPLAASTPLLALERLILIPQIPIRLLALQRFCLTPPAQKTRPMGQPRLNLTITAATTLLSVLLRSLATPAAPSTRPLGFKRSLPIPARIAPAPPIPL